MQENSRFKKSFSNQGSYNATRVNKIKVPTPNPQQENIDYLILIILFVQNVTRNMMVSALLARVIAMVVERVVK